MHFTCLELCFPFFFVLSLPLLLLFYFNYTKIYVPAMHTHTTRPWADTLTCQAFIRTEQTNFYITKSHTLCAVYECVYTGSVVVVVVYDAPSWYMIYKYKCKMPSGSRAEKFSTYSHFFWLFSEFRLCCCY